MATEFTHFPNLPRELRHKIWKFCIPEGRVFEFDVPHALAIGTSCSVVITSEVNARPPPFSQVCRESRDVAFTEGGYLSDVQARWNAKGLLEMPEFESAEEYAINKIERPWFYPKSDIVHLNWEDSYSAWFDSEHNPLPALIEYSRICRGGSIRAAQLLSFADDYPKDSLGHPRGLEYTLWGTEPPPLEWLDGFKVCILIISIHTTDTRVIGSGLFGGLAAPIQLVDTSDRETIRRMYDLWWTTFYGDDNPKFKDTEPKEIFEEMILTPDDFESRVDRWHEEIQLRWLWSKWSGKFYDHTLHTIVSPEDVFTGPRFDHDGNVFTGLHIWQIRMPEHAFNMAHPWVQEVVKNMPRFQSVIMFRYCSVKCYALGRPQAPKYWGLHTDKPSYYKCLDREKEKLFWKDPFAYDPLLIEDHPPPQQSPSSKN